MNLPNPAWYVQRMLNRTPVANERIYTPKETVPAMATAPVVPVVKKPSILSHIAAIARKVFHIGEEAAVIAEPFIATAFPNIVPIYNSAISLAMQAETTVGSVQGTGAEKLAKVAETLVPQLQSWAKANNIAWDEAAITKWSSAVVDTLNLIPAPTV